MSSKQPESKHPKTITVSSPAKINLHLQLLGKRDDEFHNLFSLFHLVSLADTICVKNFPGDDSLLNLSGKFPVPPEKNIITTAVNLFREATGYRKNLDMKVEKIIPDGAGLGGGSSNAAYTLSALEKLTGIKLPEKKAEEICLKLGSDVLFFRKSTAALVSGRGEIIEAIDPLPPLSVLIVHPGIVISSAEAFSLYAKQNKKRETPPDTTPKPSKNKLLKSLKENPEKWPFFNDFKDLLKEPYPVLAHIEDLLYSSGSAFSSLTGSGSAVFGVFTDSIAFDRAERAIKKDFSFCYKARLLEINPFFEI